MEVLSMLTQTKPFSFWSQCSIGMQELAPSVGISVMR